MAQFDITLDEAILSQGTPELTLIYLINCYDFNLGDLKARLTGMQYKTVISETDIACYAQVLTGHV